MSSNHKTYLFLAQLLFRRLCLDRKHTNAASRLLWTEIRRLQTYTSENACCTGQRDMVIGRACVRCDTAIRVRYGPIYRRKSRGRVYEHTVRRGARRSSRRRACASPNRGVHSHRAVTAKRKERKNTSRARGYCVPYGYGYHWGAGQITVTLSIITNRRYYQTCYTISTSTGRVKNTSVAASSEFVTAAAVAGVFRSEPTRRETRILSL